MPVGLFFFFFKFLTSKSILTLYRAGSRGAQYRLKGLQDKTCDMCIIFNCPKSVFFNWDYEKSDLTREVKLIVIKVVVLPFYR